MNQFPEIDAILAENTDTSTVRGTGKLQYKNLKVLDADGRVYANLGVRVDKNAKKKIEDLNQLFGAVGFTVTDEAYEVEEVAGMDFSAFGSKK